jgi:hypothetical protein
MTSKFCISVETGVAILKVQIAVKNCAPLHCRLLKEAILAIIKDLDEIVSSTLSDAYREWAQKESDEFKQFIRDWSYNDYLKGK